MRADDSDDHFSGSWESLVDAGAPTFDGASVIP
jgi:hypothetical protein